MLAALAQVTGAGSRRAAARNLEIILAGCDPALAEAAQRVFRSRSILLGPSTNIIPILKTELTPTAITRAVLVNWAIDQGASGPAAAWAVSKKTISADELNMKARMLHHILSESQQLHDIATCLIEKRSIPTSLARRQKRHTLKRQTESMVNEPIATLMA